MALGAACSRTLETGVLQPVVGRGPYRVIRHLGYLRRERRSSENRQWVTDVWRDMQSRPPTFGRATGDRGRAEVVMRPMSAEARSEARIAPPRPLAIVVVAALLVGACSSASSSPAAGGVAGASGGAASSAAAPSSASGGSLYGGASNAPASLAPAASAPELKSGTSASLGPYLTDGAGRTLYLYKPDQDGNPPTSNCSDSCASVWPPFSVASGAHVTAGPGVTGAITTFTRSDGSLQVAYKGIPLYYFVGDTAPGQTNGQNYGGIWFIVKP